ncbi:MAG: reprolysin-like metallopeptidase [Chitinophagales bacterium]
MQKYVCFCWFLLFSCTPQLKSYLISSLEDPYIIRKQIPAPRTNLYSWQNNLPDTVYRNSTSQRIIKVRYNFIKAASQNEYFSQEAAEKFAQTLNAAANFRFYHNQKMHLPEGNNTPVFPINLKLEITPDNTVQGDNGIAVYEEEDAAKAYFNKQGTGKNLFSSYVYDQYGKNKNEVLNIFVMEHHPDSIASPTYKAEHNGVGSAKYLKIAGAYHTSRDSVLKNDKSGKRAKNGWDMIGIIVHELGHTFGLAHTWNANDGCDDTPRNDNCYSPNTRPDCPGGYSNNMMDYNYCQCSLSPCQIGRIHSNINKNNSQLRKFVKEDWCDYNPSMKVKIREADTLIWYGNRQLHADLILGSNAYLEIRGNVHLPENAQLKIGSGATLFLNGGRLYNDCDAQWGGIVIESIKAESGKVILSKEALIENCAFEQDIGI